MPERRFKAGPMIVLLVVLMILNYAVIFNRKIQADLARSTVMVPPPK